MSSPFCGPITLWLTGLRDGEERAATDLLNECERVLTPVVRRKLRSRHSSYETADVLQSCLGRFGSHVRKGRYPGIVDRGSLWAYLLTSALNKLSEYRRRESRLRRGGGGKWSRAADDCHELPDGAPDADERVIFEDVLEHAIRLLPSETFRAIARLDLVEHLNPEEIALELGCSTATVYRKLQIIRELWSQNLTELMATV